MKSRWRSFALQASGVCALAYSVRLELQNGHCNWPWRGTLGDG